MRTCLRLIAACLLSASLAAAAHAQFDMTVSASPSPAGKMDPVVVHLRGTWAHGCVPEFFQLVSGISIPQPAGEPPYEHT